MNISELVIYRNLKHEDLFEDMASLMGLGSSEKADGLWLCRTACRTGCRIRL